MKGYRTLAKRHIAEKRSRRLMQLMGEDPRTSLRHRYFRHSYPKASWAICRMPRA